MNVHLISGTYELFRHYFAACPRGRQQRPGDRRRPGFVLRSLLLMIERGATHMGVATDHVIESFRNDLYAGYKTSQGVPANLLSQSRFWRRRSSHGDRGLAYGLLKPRQ